jgi:hypothetical protein
MVKLPSGDQVRHVEGRDHGAHTEDGFATRKHECLPAEDGTVSLSVWALSSFRLFGSRLIAGRDSQSRVIGAIHGLAKQDQKFGTTLTSRINALGAEINRHLQSVKSDIDHQTNAASELVTKLKEIYAEYTHALRICDILESLHYPSIYDRHSQIVEAHSSTFEWIFNPNQLKTARGRRPAFEHWLRSEEKLFWITGKPGSGKSTLVKWLCAHDRTKALLESWAGPSSLVIARHFFWCAGTELQQSQTGLLRSLLFDALRGYTAIIPEVVGDRWAATEPSVSIVKIRPWTSQELSACFARLGNLQNLPVRFCFFVDGLDEYYGDHEDLIELVKNTAKSSNIKLCVSSRPWNVFQQAFGDSSTYHLKLEDLTRDDIRRFTEDRLFQDKRFQALQQREPKCQELIDEIRDAADGVFLWVFLVVRSLLRGLTNADTMSELRRRLHLMSSDLGKLFKHILDTTEEVYHEKQALLFITASHAHSPLSLMTYSFIDEDNPNFALDLPIAPVTGPEKLKRLCRTKTRINAHCNGLLDCISSPKSFVADQLLAGTLALERGALSPSMLSKGFRVTFLHRTVRDFIGTKEMDELLTGRFPREKQPSIWICHALLAELKTIDLKMHSERLKAILRELLNKLALYAYEAEVRHGVVMVDIFDVVEDIFCSIPPDVARDVVLDQALGAGNMCLVALRQLQSWNKPASDETTSASFRAFVCFVVQSRLARYVQHKIESSWRKLHHLEDVALAALLPTPYLGSTIVLPEQRNSIFQLLLLGSPLERNIWRKHLYGVISLWKNTIDEPRDTSLVRGIREGLSAGADANIRDSEASPTILSQVLREARGKTYQQLCKVLLDYGVQW